MNNKDCSVYKLRLSSEEACVLAGVLKYNIIFGIKADMLSKWKSALNSRIRRVIKQLEHRKLISVHLEGTVIVNPYLRKIMMCLCHPDAVLSVVDESKSAEGQVYYVMKNSENYVTVQKTAPKGYTILLFERPPHPYVLLPYEAPDKDINIVIPSEQHAVIFDCVQNFDSEAATHALNQLFGDENITETALSLMQSPIIKAMVYKKGNASVLQCRLSMQLATDGNTMYLVEAADQSTTYTTINQQKINHMIENAFEKEC